MLLYVETIKTEKKVWYVLIHDIHVMRVSQKWKGILLLRKTEARRGLPTYADIIISGSTLLLDSRLVKPVTQ